MLALCLMVLATYYAQNYAGIIGWGLVLCVAVMLGVENEMIFNAIIVACVD